MASAGWPLASCCFAGSSPTPAPATSFVPPAPAPTTSVTPAPARGAPWDPARTVVFAAGLLRWRRHDLYDSFPRVERRDRALVETLMRRGVPEARITHLTDRAATLEAARNGLAASLAAAGPEDTFLFYWAGHGDRTDSGASYAVPFDGGDDTPSSCLGYEEVVRAVEGSRAARALLFADTCYSGAIADQAVARGGGPARAGFGASSASQTSTGAWTFTDAIISAFDGTAYADRDRDRIVTVSDLSRFVQEEMAFADGQLANVQQTADFPLTLQLAAAAAAPCTRFGERVEVLGDGTWWPATITGEPPDGRLDVHYDGYTERWDATVTVDETRPYAPTQYRSGTRVSVQWNEAWYPATVRDARLGVHFVHYDDYAETWDEWVSIDRIRLV